MLASFCRGIGPKNAIKLIQEHKTIEEILKHIDTKKSAEAAESMYSKQEAGLEGVETVGESGRIFIRNLAYCVTEEDISDLFSEFGPLTETTVPVDKNTRKYKGFAFVTFMLPEHAVKVR